MVADFILRLVRNNIVAVLGHDRNGVAVVRNHHVVADRFDMTPLKVL